MTQADLNIINQFLKDLDQLNLDAYNDLEDKKAADFLDDIVTNASADIVAKFPDPVPEDDPHPEYRGSNYGNE